MSDESEDRSDLGIQALIDGHGLSKWCIQLERIGLVDSTHPAALQNRNRYAGT